MVILVFQLYYQQNVIFIVFRTAVLELVIQLWSSSYLKGTARVETLPFISDFQKLMGIKIFQKYERYVKWDKGGG